MIVIDASAAVDLLLDQRLAGKLRDALAPHHEVHVPEHFHVEAISALRRLRLHGGLGEQRAQQALRGLARLRAIRYPIMPIAEPIWALRDRLSAYDASYLALAARLDIQLLTVDQGLAAVASDYGHLAPLP